MKQPRRSLKSYLIERSQSDMEVTGTSALTWSEYLASIKLDTNFMQVVQKTKNSPDEYVYLFQVELKNFGVQEKVVTWK